MRHKNYWVAREWIRKAGFRWRKLTLKSRNRRLRFQGSTSVFLYLCRKAVPSLAIIIVLLSGVLYLDGVLARLNTNNWPALTTDFHDWYICLQATFDLHSNDLKVLFTVIASMSGLFLGLYFTAVSIVSSAVYANVYSGIREHFLREQGGALYLRMLSTATAASLLLTAYLGIGFTPGVIATVLVFTLGCLGVVAFVQLGMRTFHFLNPTILSNAIFAELIKSARLATCKGVHWQDRSFQVGYRNLASEELRNLESTLELAVQKEYIQKESLKSLCDMLALFLCEYGELRRLIPSDSYWYRRIPEYQNTFLCSDSELILSIETGTSIQPKLVADRHWLEGEMLTMIGRSIEKLLSDNNLMALYSLLIAFQPFVEKLGQLLEVKDGRRLLRILLEPIDVYLSQTPVSKDTENLKLRLAVMDLTKLCFLWLALGYFKEVGKWDSKEIGRRCRETNWRSQSSIYEQGLPPQLLPRLEWMKSCLQVERNVEGYVVSPVWYKEQLIAGKLNDIIASQLQEVLSILDEFASEAGELIRRKDPTAAASHCQRGIELSSKVEAHLTNLRAAADDLKKTRVDDDIPWTEIDWKMVQNRISAARTTITDYLAHSMIALPVERPDDQIPDLFGQAYNTICWECHLTLAANDTKRFGQLFPIVATSAIAAGQKLATDLADWMPESQIAISGDPFLDLLHLSGYAIIYSELYHSRALWNCCRKAWTGLLKAYPKPTELVAYLIGLHEIRHGSLRISARQMIRTKWQLALNATLREQGIISDRFSLPFMDDAPQAAVHRSKLIRKLTANGQHEPLATAVDVFIALYLTTLPIAQNIEYNNRYQLSPDLFDPAEVNEEQNNDE